MLAGLVLLSAVLLSLRFPLRFNQISFAYAAYYEPFYATLAREGPGALFQFVGLHPPLYSLMNALIYRLWAAIGAYHLLSALCSILAVGVVAQLGRQAAGAWVGAFAGLLTAVGVYPLHYALEVNNYPLFLLVSATTQWTFLRLLQRASPARFALWLLCSSLHLYTHILAGVLLVAQGSVLGILLLLRWRRALRGSRAAQILSIAPDLQPSASMHTSAPALQRPSPRGQLLKHIPWRPLLMALALALLLGLPLVRSVLMLAGRESTFHNPSLGLTALWRVTVLGGLERFGGTAVALLGLLLLLRAVLGALWHPPHRRALLGLLPALLTLPVILLLVRLGIAAPHQYPYYLLLWPGLAVCVAWGGLRTGPGGFPPAGDHPRFPPGLRLTAAGVLGAAWARLTSSLAFAGLLALVGTQLLYDMGEIWLARARFSQFERQPHALRVALEASAPGDALWLIAPPLFGDDDKRAIDPVYSLLDPWRTCRYYQPKDMPFEYLDYRYGQPVRCEDLVLHTFTDVYALSMPRALTHHLSRGARVWIVLYDIQTTPNYQPRLEQLLSAFPHSSQTVGPSLLYRVGGS